MGSVKYFTSIHLCSGYWQCCIADEDISKTVFLTRYGLYEWVIMPMGLTNAPTTFMQTMNNLFSDMLDFGMVGFLNDILMYLCIVNEHFMVLEKVLAYLCHYKFYCKLKKCSFLHNNTLFLGFDVMPKGMHISDSKV